MSSKIWQGNRRLRQAGIASTQHTADHYQRSLSSFLDLCVTVNHRLVSWITRKHIPCGEAKTTHSANAIEDFLSRAKRAAIRQLQWPLKL